MLDVAAINEALAPKRDALIFEGLHVAGAGFAVGETSIKPPVAGSLTLMEAVGLPWARGEGKATEDDVRAAVVILNLREDAAGLVMQAVGQGYGAVAVAAYCLDEIDMDAARDSITAYFSIAVTGFNYLPKPKEKKSDAPMFQADFLAVVMRIMGGLSVPPFRAIWREPLARVGFLLAYTAIANGEKNVGRFNTLDWSKAWRNSKQP